MAVQIELPLTHFPFRVKLAGATFQRNVLASAEWLNSEDAAGQFYVHTEVVRIKLPEVEASHFTSVQWLYFDNANTAFEFKMKFC